MSFIQEQHAWYFLLSVVGVFDFVKNKGKSVILIFCFLAGLAVLAEKVEGALMLAMGSFILLGNTFSKSKLVLLGFASSLIFISGGLDKDAFGIICFLIYVFLIVLDWPFAGLLRVDEEDEKTLINSRLLIYVSTLIFSHIIYQPSEPWVAVVFFVFSAISLFGSDKNRAVFLLFLGLIWLKPELQLFAPAVAILSLANRWSTTLLQIFVLYVVGTVSFPIDSESLLAALVAAGLFMGWMTADQPLPKLKGYNPKENAREIVFVSMAILAIVALFLEMTDKEKLFYPQQEYPVFIAAALVIETIKRAIPALNKIKFNKELRQTGLDLLSFFPILKTLELKKREDEVGPSGFMAIGKNYTPNYESRNLSLGVFAIILWSIVIWHYYNT